MALPVTSLSAAIATLVYVGLTLRVVRLRRHHKIAIGDGGNLDLRAAINGHNNFSQYVPLTLILLGLSEVQNVPKLVIAAMAIAVTLGRAIHYYSITRSTLANPIRFRRWGMRLTLIPMIILALALGALSIRGFL